MISIGNDIAYCGPAPTPDGLIWAWNPDIFALACVASLLALHWRFGRPGTNGRFGVAATLLLFLFVSPLCALTVALFSARVVHHVLLVSVVAPLLVFAFRDAGTGWKKVPLSMLVAVHALVLWFWHVPQIYALGVESAAAYWAMQVTLLGSAFLMWQSILSRSTSTGAAVLALLATVVQMGMLGALLTFAQEPLYPLHALSTVSFGLTALDDQQLGGIVMWVPAALPYVAAAMLLLSRQLGHIEAGTVAR